MPWQQKLRDGAVIPAHPLALNASRKLDERRQRALTRYYVAAGAGGVAVGVHTTQFAIREPEIGLFRAVLELASEELRDTDLIRVAGIAGGTAQAVREAELAVELGYHTGLLSLGALRNATVDELIDHAAEVARVIPVLGFYLQPAAGGRLLPYRFWCRFASIENVIGIKIAPFNRYQTIDVLRGVADSGRSDALSLYTGNDDSIVLDLLTSFRFSGRSLRFAGGLLGHWAVWTRRAVELHARLHHHTGPVPPEWLTLAQSVTDTNAAFFDTANNFHGCIAGIHEVLRRQGLLEGRWCLDPDEDLSPGQMEEIDRVYREYPDLNDDEFVEKHRGEWLR
jgi:dihydrodipicolinate synthase/N-acetylneuraminate lyase